MAHPQPFEPFNMPLIPKLNPTGPIANAPAPVLDRERRPNVSLGGVIDAVGQLGRASQMPLDNNDVTQGWRALGAVGEAVMQAGGVGLALHRKRVETNERLAMKEAEADMLVRGQELSAFYEANQNNTGAWTPEAQRVTGDVLARWKDDPRLTKAGRDDLALRLQTWAKTTAIHAESAGAQADFRRLGAQYELSAAKAYESGDKAAGDAQWQEAVKGGYASPEKAQFEMWRGEKAIKARNLGDAEQRYKTAVLIGDDEQMNAALAEGKKWGWTDSDIEFMRTKGAEDARQNREVVANRDQHDFLAELMFRRAQGEVIVPSQIEGLVRDGKIDKATGARMMIAAKSEVGAMPGEFSAFIDEVALYDPDNDPKYAKAAELQRRAAELGLRPDQAAQFNAVFEKAQKENADVTKRIETAGLVAARQTFRDAFAKGGLTKVWTPDLEAALSDQSKLMAYGIPDVAAKKIVALMTGKDSKIPKDYPAALREFREAAKFPVAKPPEAITKPGGWFGKDETAPLSQAARAVFDKAASADASGLAEDPQKAMESAFAQETLIRQMESWFVSETKKNGVPPDDMAVKRKTGEMLSAKLQGAASAALRPKPMGDGAAISIRGFSEAPDLADRLPEPLKPYAQTFVEAARRNGLDPYALAAISMHETAGGTSNAFTSKNNAMGISDSSGPVSMSSVEASIDQQAATLARKNGPYAGADDLASIGAIYAPVGASNDPRGLNGGWASGVSRFYRELTAR